jgi:serine/threonine-protein kinase RsbW
MSDSAATPPFRDAVVIDGGMESLAGFEARVEVGMAERGYSPAERFAVRLAIEEGVANAIHHGNRGRPGKVVRLGCEVGAESVQVSIEDEGEGFDPTVVPDPTDESNLEIPSGRGLMLMRAYMTEVRHAPPGNRVEMVYRKGAKPDG